MSTHSQEDLSKSEKPDGAKKTPGQDRGEDLEDAAQQQGETLAAKVGDSGAKRGELQTSQPPLSGGEHRDRDGAKAAATNSSGGVETEENKEEEKAESSLEKEIADITHSLRDANINESSYFELPGVFAATESSTPDMQQYAEVARKNSQYFEAITSVVNTCYEVNQVPKLSLLTELAVINARDVYREFALHEIEVFDDISFDNTMVMLIVKTKTDSAEKRGRALLKHRFEKLDKLYDERQAASERYFKREEARRIAEMKRRKAERERSAALREAARIEMMHSSNSAAAAHALAEKPRAMSPQERQMSSRLSRNEQAVHGEHQRVLQSAYEEINREQQAHDMQLQNRENAPPSMAQQHPCENFNTQHGIKLLYVI